MMRKIYLISTEQDDKTLYKIGFTKRKVEQRIKEFQTGNSNIFTIVDIFEPQDYAVTIEKKLHRNFSDKNINGEWFELDDNDIGRFRELCTKFYDECKFVTENNTYLQDMNYSFK